MNRRAFLQSAAAGVFSAVCGKSAQSSKPNIVFIYADDLGYGDLSCYGSSIKTPNLDNLAAQGVRFTDFNSASAVCSPARAALLTGRYGNRIGVPAVLDANDPGGLVVGQKTIGDVMKSAGYDTACIGKWHVGSQPQFMPNARGFDYFYGLPYSHDMWPRPLMRNSDVIEQPATVDTLTSRFTAEAVQYIKTSRQNPFFLYLPYTAPHVPLAPGAKFKWKSHRGVYYDVVQEMDSGVGDVLQSLRDMKIADNTIVMFASDNGPWHQGSIGNLRGRKGENYEGGVRGPFIARWNNKIPANRTVTGVASHLDILPTLANMVGASVPHQTDGIDIWPMLSGAADSIERDPLLYFDWWTITAARVGSFKIHFSRYNTLPYVPPPAEGKIMLPLPKPELYDLSNDADEGSDLADELPNIVADMTNKVQAMLPSLPDPVQSNWSDIRKLKVENTPSGSLPILVKTRVH